jgi:class 3 adenylate cyclase/predicted ATPase
MSDLRQWLKSLGLDCYAEVFAKNNIDSKTLADLTEQDLAALGVSLGHRKRLLGAVPGDHLSSPKISRHEGARSRQNLRAERRHLTVAFYDLVGSAALAAQLDPEDLREILHEFQSICSDAIRRYDGHIAQFLGDRVLTYFGFPRAHEDDAERAVRAALQAIVSASKFATRGGQMHEIRIGIATGLVVVGDLIGDGSGREFELIGEAPNLAARLLELAEPNQILVAPSTRKLLGDLFEFEDLGDQRIKGFDQQVHLWRAIRPSSVSSRFEARHPAHLTRLIGRDTELKLLREHYLRAKNGQGRMIVISGEPGIGKSRLTLALTQSISEDCRLISFQCSSYHTNSAWYPIVHFLQRAAGITPETSHSLQLDRLEEFVRQILGKNDEFVALLAALLSIPTGARYAPLELTPQQQKNRTFAAVLTLLEAQTKQQPVLLVFEDVHWIDPTSFELLKRIRDRIAHWRMLAVISARSDFGLSWAEHPHATNLAIKRLGRQDVTAMIDSMNAEASLPPAVIEQIIAKAEGLPLFVEEITNAVVEDANRKLTAGQQSLDVQSTFMVPATLHESLMARLNLAAQMKTVAQIASVIGREFSLKLLNAVAKLPERSVRAAVDRLLQSGLLVQTSESNSQTFMFKHALVQDEAYASLLRADRRAIHIRTAEALCGDLADVAKAAPEIVAHHYTQAGQIMPAIDYWARAGRLAGERFAFAEAGTHLQIALKLLAEVPEGLQRDEVELQLQHALGNVLIASKGFGATETGFAFRRSLELCRKFEGSPQTVTVINGIIGVHLMREEFEQARILAEGLVARGEKRQDAPQQLMGHRAFGMSLFYMGNFVDACDHLRAAIELYNATPLPPLATVFSQDQKATAQAYLALAFILRGDIRRGLELGHDAAAYAERLRHPHSLAYVLAFLAGAYVLCNEPDAARPIAERTIAISTEHGFPLWLAGARLMRGWTLVEQGDTEQGLEEIRHSMVALEATGALSWVQFARYLLAQALAKAGQFRDAAQLVDQTLAALAGTSGRWCEAELHRLRGDLLLRCDAFAAAEACYEDAIAVAERQGARLWQLRAANGLAACWHVQGKTLQAHDRLARLCASFDESIAGADLERAKALLDATDSDNTK